MTEPNEVQAIEKISAAVGESQMTIIHSNQCMKAQAFLLNRLNKRTERQEEIAKSISNENVKLAAEIANAEQEINCLRQAHESIKSSNVELMKELQLAKERTKETKERARIGIQKFDKLWEESKRRFESLGFVQEFGQATKKKEALQAHAAALEKEIQTLRKELKIKKEKKAESTRKEIIELAEYMVHGKPKIEEQISVLSKEIKVLNSQIEEIMKNRKEQNIQKDKEDRVQADLGAPTKNLSNMVIDDDTLMPKLQLMDIDLDVMSVKLGQIKKSDLVTYSPVKDVTSEHKKIDTGVTSDVGVSMSLYFQNPKNVSKTAELNEGRDAQNYSKRKLINILDDIKLDKSDTYNIVSKVDVNSFQWVSEITANFNKHGKTPKESTTVEQDKNQAQDEEIEEIDLTSSNIIMPPSGFLDQLRSSQEKRKKVSFDMPSTVQETLSDPKNLSTQKDDDNENEANATTDICPMDESAESEESFTKTKDMILKKRYLDLSPQFVYGKNTATPLVLQKQDEVVKSNYFNISYEELPTISLVPVDTAELNNEEDEKIECDKPAPTNDDNEAGNDVEIEVCNNVISSAKENQDHVTMPVAGLLFSHGATGIPDSLNMSINTTGFEDGDADYPQYSSLLLSPKADLPMPSTSEESNVLSQDVPNFLSGLRKSGLSFFGNMASLNTGEGNTSSPSGSNPFNFAFGSDDKQKRGGIFNMFN